MEATRVCGDGVHRIRKMTVASLFGSLVGWGYVVVIGLGAS